MRINTTRVSSFSGPSRRRRTNSWERCLWGWLGRTSYKAKYLCWTQTLGWPHRGCPSSKTQLLAQIKWIQALESTQASKHQSRKAIWLLASKTHSNSSIYQVWIESTSTKTVSLSRMSLKRRSARNFAWPIYLAKICSKLIDQTTWQRLKE